MRLITLLLLLTLTFSSAQYATRRPTRLPAVTQPPIISTPTEYVYDKPTPIPDDRIYPDTDTDTDTDSDSDTPIVVIEPTRAPAVTQPPVRPTTRPTPTLPPVVITPTRPTSTLPPVVVNPPSRLPAGTQIPAILYPIYPTRCDGDSITPRICAQGGELPEGCRPEWIQWDACQCEFWCNSTAAPVGSNPTQTVVIDSTPQPTPTPVDTVTITTNVTRPGNNTRCIAGICITFNGATTTSMVSFPVVMAVLLGLAMLV